MFEVLEQIDFDSVILVVFFYGHCRFHARIHDCTNVPRCEEKPTKEMPHTFPQWVKSNHQRPW